MNMNMTKRSVVVNCRLHQSHVIYRLQLWASEYQVVRVRFDSLIIGLNKNWKKWKYHGIFVSSF